MNISEIRTNILSSLQALKSSNVLELFKRNALLRIARQELPLRFANEIKKFDNPFLLLADKLDQLSKSKDFNTTALLCEDISYINCWCDASMLDYEDQNLPTIRRLAHAFSQLCDEDKEIFKALEDLIDNKLFEAIPRVMWKAQAPHIEKWLEKLAKNPYDCEIISIGADGIPFQQQANYAKQLTEKGIKTHLTLIDPGFAGNPPVKSVVDRDVYPFDLPEFYSEEGKKLYTKLLDTLDTLLKNKKRIIIASHTGSDPIGEIQWLYNELAKKHPESVTLIQQVGTGNMFSTYVFSHGKLYENSAGIKFQNLDDVKL